MSNAWGSATISRLTRAVLLRGERQFLLFICRAGHSCRDRCSSSGAAALSLSDSQIRSRGSPPSSENNASKLKSPSLKTVPPVVTLGFALFMVLTIRMALVIVVVLFPTLAMVLAVAVPLGLGMAAVAVAIALYGRGFGLAAALQDVGSRPAPNVRTTAMAIRCFLLMVDLLVFIVILSSAVRLSGNRGGRRAGDQHRPLRDEPRQVL